MDFLANQNASSDPVNKTNDDKLKKKKKTGKKKKALNRIRSKNVD